MKQAAKSFKQSFRSRLAFRYMFRITFQSAQFVLSPILPFAKIRKEASYLFFQTRTIDDDSTKINSTLFPRSRRNVDAVDEAVFSSASSRSVVKRVRPLLHHACKQQLVSIARQRLQQLSLNFQLADIFVSSQFVRSKATNFSIFIAFLRLWMVLTFPTRIWIIKRVVRSSCSIFFYTFVNLSLFLLILYEY